MKKYEKTVESFGKSQYRSLLRVNTAKSSLFLDPTRNTIKYYLMGTNAYRQFLINLSYNCASVDLQQTVHVTILPGCRIPTR